MKVSIVLSLFIISFLGGCGEDSKASLVFGDVPMVVGMFERYRSQNVRVVGYMHQRSVGSALELIPTKDHSHLQPPATIFSLMLLPNKEIRNGSVDKEMQECLGKITYVSGVADTYLGVPAIKKVMEVSC